MVSVVAEQWVNDCLAEYYGNLTSNILEGESTVFSQAQRLLQPASVRRGAEENRQQNEPVEDTGSSRVASLWNTILSPHEFAHTGY
jgi:hypothetical protein